MSTSALLGQGVTLAVGATPITGIVSVNFPSIKAPMVDKSDLLSTVKVFLAGLVDGGQVSFSAHFDKTLYDLLAAMVAGQSVGSWVLALNNVNENQWEFSGFITSLGGPGPDPDGKLMYDCVVKITGVPDFTFNPGKWTPDSSGMW